MLAAYPTRDVQQLAAEVYVIVLARKYEIRRCITYTQVCERLDPRKSFFGRVEADDLILSLALRYIIERCRAAELPALSALVVNARTRRPGQGYYLIAHNVEMTDPSAEQLWRRERGLVWLCRTYPPQLP